MLTKDNLQIGGRYNWKHQPERLVYLGMCEPRNGRWHQFAKVESPSRVWCEVLAEDLHMLEESAEVVLPPGMRAVEDDTDLMPMPMWKEARECGYIIPSDGSGYWATESLYSWDYPVFSTPKPEWATHVMWFNK